MTNVYVGRNGENLQIPSSLFLVLCNRDLEKLSGPSGRLLEAPCKATPCLAPGASAAVFSALILTIRQKRLFFDGCIDSLPPAAACHRSSGYADVSFFHMQLRLTKVQCTSKVSNSLASWCQYSSKRLKRLGERSRACFGRWKCPVEAFPTSRLDCKRQRKALRFFR